ncbi:hypothetical protein MMC17_007609 [Xylographa soralifera]|nr:hypothetical protein [Xylographa soralifera]
MSPIIPVRQTGSLARRARKRQRRRGVNSTEEKVGLEFGVERLGKEGFDRPETRAVPQDLVMINNNYVPLLSPTTNAIPEASSMNNEPKIAAAARAPKQPNKNDIVLTPPQSAFTFSCSRPAFTTANVRSYAGSQRNTPFQISAAGSPLPKVPTSPSRLLGNDKFQGEGLLVRSKVPADKTLLSTETTEPGAQSHTHKRASPTQSQPATSMPKPEPLIMAPATKDRKSRFLAALSLMVTTNTKSLTGGNEAATGTTVPEIVTSPVCYTDALEHQIADLVVAPKHASSHGSTDSGYETKSGSPSIEVSPTWRHSPSSEHEWQGRDVGFWMRD